MIVDYLISLKHKLENLSSNDLSCIDVKEDKHLPIDLTWKEIETLEDFCKDFFPETGRWSNSCFEKPHEVRMSNLPCHLRDDKWLAKLIQKQCNLEEFEFAKILKFVRTSTLFNKLRHNYELEIVKWQIEWMKNGGEGWVCDDAYGGDIAFLTPMCDFAFRKGVVDTLSAIGMNLDVIEEGLETYSYLWRDFFMERAFSNQFEPIYYSITGDNGDLNPTDEVHKYNWLKLRRYQYYLEHKNSVDKYGSATPDMLMNEDEAREIADYLYTKNNERLSEIKQYKIKKGALMLKH